MFYHESILLLGVHDSPESVTAFEQNGLACRRQLVQSISRSQPRTAATNHRDATWRRRRCRFHGGKNLVCEVLHGILKNGQALTRIMPFASRPPGMLSPIDVTFRMWH